MVETSIILKHDRAKQEAEHITQSIHNPRLAYAKLRFGDHATFTFEKEMDYISFYNKVNTWLRDLSPDKRVDALAQIDGIVKIKKRCPIRYRRINGRLQCTLVSSGKVNTELLGQLENSYISK